MCVDKQVHCVIKIIIFSSNDKFSFVLEFTEQEDETLPTEVDLVHKDKSFSKEHNFGK